MRQAKIRKNYATGTAHGHATFSNLFNSIRDYFERQKNFKIPNIGTAGYVAATVKSNYAEDKKYAQKWLSIFNTVSVNPVVRYSHYFVVIICFVLCLAFFRYIYNVASAPTQNKRDKFNYLKHSKN